MLGELEAIHHGKTKPVVLALRRQDNLRLEIQ